MGPELSWKKSGEKLSGMWSARCAERFDDPQRSCVVTLQVGGDPSDGFLLKGCSATLGSVLSIVRSLTLVSNLHDPSGNGTALEALIKQAEDCFARMFTQFSRLREGRRGYQLRWVESDATITVDGLTRWGACCAPPVYVQAIAVVACVRAFFSLGILLCASTCISLVRPCLDACMTGAHMRLRLRHASEHYLVLFIRTGRYRKIKNARCPRR